MEPAGCTHGCHTGDLGAPMTASRVSPRLGCTTGCPQSCCVPMPRVSLYQTRPWCPPTPGPAPMGDLGVPEGGRKGRRHPAPRHLRGCRKSWVLSAPTSLGHSSPATASTQLIAPAAVMTGDPWWHWVAYGGSGCPVVVSGVPRCRLSHGLRHHRDKRAVAVPGVPMPVPVPLPVPVLPPMHVPTRTPPTSTLPSPGGIPTPTRVPAAPRRHRNGGSGAAETRSRAQPPAPGAAPGGETGPGLF